MDRIFLAVKKLKRNKAVGIDYVSNEMILHGVSNEVLSILKLVFNNMVQHGYTPKDFNIALVTPIPKKGEMKVVDD